MFWFRYTFTDIVFVVAVPAITKQPRSVVVQAYSVVSFECAARSYGAVSITWKRMNSEIPITAQITVSKSLNEITSTLRLESIGYYEGYYYCEIENSAGIVDSTLAHYEISGTHVDMYIAFHIIMCTYIFKLRILHTYIHCTQLTVYLCVFLLVFFQFLVRR